MITLSACASRSSQAPSTSSPHGTSMQTSSTGRASSPEARNSWSSRSRSGMRAASTWTVSLIPEVCPRDPAGKPVSSGPMAVATGREYGLFINGELVEPQSGQLRDLREPATGAPLAKAAMAGEADVDRAVEAARAALEGPWGKTPPNERSRLLHALADAIVANRKELTELETRNVGKAVSSVKGEVAVSAENFRWYASAIASIAGRTTPIGGSILAYTLKEPVGVAAQIVPWNYPIMMAAWKLAPALAAGCTVVLKPDPATPLTVLRVAELAAEVGIPAGVVNIVPGDGPTTGSYLVQHR